MADIDVLNGLGLQPNTPVPLEALEIHKLTQAQYDTLLSNNLVNENAIYMTPNETFDISTLATVEQLNEKADKKHPHSFDDIKQKTDGENSETLSTVLDTMNLAIGGKIDKGNSLAHYGIQDAVSQTELEIAFNTHEANHAEANAQVNVIESIIFNNEALTPDANKAVAINCVVADDIKDFVKKDDIVDAYTKSEIDAMFEKVAHISTDENENIQITNEINQQIIAAVNAALSNAKASGEFDGRDGETPVKGEDYFTVTEKNEMIEAVLARIPVGNEVAY